MPPSAAICGVRSGDQFSPGRSATAIPAAWAVDGASFPLRGGVQARSGPE